MLLPIKSFNPNKDSEISAIISIPILYMRKHWNGVVK